MGQGPEADLGPGGEDLLTLPGEQGHPRIHQMGPAGQLAEHEPGLGLVGGFPEDDPLQGDQGIGGQDKGLGEAGQNGPGLGSRQLFDQVIFSQGGLSLADLIHEAIFITV